MKIMDVDKEQAYLSIEEELKEYVPRDPMITAYDLWPAAQGWAGDKDVHDPMISRCLTKFCEHAVAPWHVPKTARAVQICGRFINRINNECSCAYRLGCCNRPL